MHRRRLTLLTLSLTLTALACTPTAGGEDNADPSSPIVLADEDPGAHSLQWREDSDAVDSSPVSLTATDGTGLQLVSLDARAVLEDPLAFTELTMVFRNPEERVREGRFEINLPPGAAISRFAMKVDGQWQEAEMVERQAAQRAYEDFLHRRQDPALLEKKAGNQFRARVFPIPANGVKEIKISYSQELRNSHEPYRVLLKGLPRIATLDVDVAIVRPSESTMSSSQGGSSSSVEHLTIHETEAAPRADLEVRVEKSITHRGLRHENLAVARVAPAMDLPAQPIEGLTILLDTSASRALGFPGQVDRLGELVAALTADHDFPLQVLCFDQDVEQVYFGPAKGFDGESRKRILARHPLGASDLESAFRWLHTGNDVQPRVLLVGDGIITAGADDHDSLRQAVARLGARGVQRVDALVDGGIQDEATLRALTTADLESAGFVASARLTPETLVHKLGHATRSGIHVSVPGAAWVWPTTLDGMQPGDEVLIYADLPADRPMTVVLEADKKQEITVPLRPTGGKLLERGWAQASVDRMKADLDGLALEETERRAALRDAIIDVSTRKRVLSDFTALLVLETDADYQRFGIDRRALSDILTVGPSGIELVDRSNSTAPGPLQIVDNIERDGNRHRGEEGRMEKAKEATGEFEAKGGADDLPQMAGEPEAPPPGDGFAPDGQAPSGATDPGALGSLSGDAIGDAFGQGGLGLVGQGRGGGGADSGGIGSLAAPHEEEAMPRPTSRDEDRRESSSSHSSGSGSGYGSGAGAGFGGRNNEAPEVRQGDAEVLGSLDRNVIRRVVRSHTSQIRACYERQLALDPALAGRLTLAFTIDGSGRVPQASIDDNSMGSSALGDCIADAARRWNFPTPEGGGVVTVRYPFTFGSGEIGSAPLEPTPSAPMESPQAQDAWSGPYAEIMALIGKHELDLATSTAWHWRESEPGSELALLGLGEAAEAKGDLMLASRAYGSLIDLFPTRADLRRMAGGRLERIAQQPNGPGLELVVDTYRHAVEQRPDHPSSHRMYAFALVKANRHEEAFAAIMAGVGRSYPDGRFRGVDRILRDDAGLIAAAWLFANPKDDARIRSAAASAGITIASGASTRFVLNWETDANDVDFHIYDARGGHASFRQMNLPSGGELYADVTTGYGPECFTIQGRPNAYPYVLQGHYYSMGPMGYGMGKLQVIEHDGSGRLLFTEQPFVIMKNQAYVDLGRLDRPLAGR